MPKHSAGIVLYRPAKKGWEVLIVHPGGPFWAKKDKAAWSIPKGEYAPEEDALAAAKREFTEEIGSPPPDGDYLDLGEVKQPSGKLVHVWALQHDFDLANFKSNMFEMEWPPRSGQKQQFEEADKAAWVSLATATVKLVKGQVAFIEKLAEQLGATSTTDEPDEAGQTSLFV